MVFVILLVTFEIRQIDGSRKSSVNNESNSRNVDTLKAVSCKKERPSESRTRTMEGKKKREGATMSKGIISVEYVRHHEIATVLDRGYLVAAWHN